MPAPRRGYSISPNSTTALSTSWSSAVALTTVATDANSEATPATGLLSALEVEVSDIAAGATSIQAMFFYDSACTRVLCGPSGASTLYTSSTDGAVGIDVGRWYRTPSTAVSSTIAPGTIYAKFKTDTGTANLRAYGARLHWTDQS